MEHWRENLKMRALALGLVWFVRLDLCTIVNLEIATSAKTILVFGKGQPETLCCHHNRFSLHWLSHCMQQNNFHMWEAKSWVGDASKKKTQMHVACCCTSPEMEGESFWERECMWQICVRRLHCRQEHRHWKKTAWTKGKLKTQKWWMTRSLNVCGVNGPFANETFNCACASSVADIAQAQTRWHCCLQKWIENVQMQCIVKSEIWAQSKWKLCLCESEVSKTNGSQLPERVSWMQTVTFPWICVMEAMLIK